MAHAQAIAAPVAVTSAGMPLVYRCTESWPTHYYRESSPGRWEIALGPDFEHPVRVEDRSRSEIEARGHVLVPMAGGDRT